MTIVTIVPATLAAIGIGAAFATTHLPIVLAYLASGGALVCLALWLPMFLVGGFDRHLDAVGSAAIRSSSLMWQARLPGVPRPTTDEERAALLATRIAPSQDPDVLPLEASMLGRLGRYDEARDRIDRMVPQTEMQAFQHAISVAHIEFERGGEGDLSTARTLSATMSGSAGRDARAELALDEAARALIAGKPWGPVIEAAYPRIGRPAIALLFQGGLGIRLPIVQYWLIVPVFVVGVAVSYFYGRM